jgi:hypothetical protein
MIDESPALDPYAWQEAWTPVLEALWEAMDVPGLPPADRAALANMHDDASTWTNHRRVSPADFTNRRRASPATRKAERERKVRAVCGPGGLKELLGAGELTAATFWVLFNADVLTVDHVRRLAESDGHRDLYAVKDIGRGRVAKILKALDRHAEAVRDGRPLDEWNPTQAERVSTRRDR